MLHRPITETPNELTTDIDVASPVEIVRLLRACDAQIQSGYGGHPALVDAEMIARLKVGVAWAAEVLGREDAAVILAGAGTSGRLAMFVARTINRALQHRGRPGNVGYLIAGGDPALIQAQEGAEDDPHRGIADVEARVVGKSQVLYIGITCALAAPYVAAQLAHMVDHPSARSILLGFNPSDRARRLPIEGWDRSFADVIAATADHPRFLLLNPVVGPEPITGSTRMKGGTATKMILEMMLGLAARRAGILTALPERGLSEALGRMLAGYEQARRAAYADVEGVATCIEWAGRALRAGRHIYYLGAGAAGILGIIDASECPPTYGAHFEDVRGFLAGGWRAMLGPGRDLSGSGEAYRIDLATFRREKLERLSGEDLVVVLTDGRAPRELVDTARQAREAGGRVVQLTAGPSGAQLRHFGTDTPLSSPDRGVHPGRLPGSPLPGAGIYAECTIKLILNAITTGAHVLAGKVYQNRMIDLKISNNKLFHRAIGIIQDLMGVNQEQARTCLLRSIYGLDELPPGLGDAPVSQHIRAAASAGKVMPTALVLAARKVSWAQARQMLADEPVIRAAIQKLRSTVAPA